MKIFAILLIMLQLHFAHAQNWSWTINIPNSSINDMKTLPSGETYLAGSFLNVQPQDSAKPEDYFLLKVDSSGNIIGGLKKGPEHLQSGLHLGTDYEGNIYVLGTPFTPQANNYYLHKYGHTGNMIWVKRFYIEGGVSAMDVNYGRIAITGNFKKILRIYEADQTTVKKSMGELCDPTYEYPCSFKSDAFIANFTVDGNLVWAEKYYSLMKSAYSWEGNVYYTTKDYDDEGLDVAIDKNQNTLFMGAFSAFDAEPATKAVFGGITIDINVEDNYPPVSAKFDPNGQTLWAFNEKNGMLYTESKQRVATDKNANWYSVREYYNPSTTELVQLKLIKRKPDSQIDWERIIKPEDPESFDLLGWSWHLDSLGNSYVQVGFYYAESEDQHILISFNAKNELISDFGVDKKFASKVICPDADNNFYFAKGNQLSKYILSNTKSFAFTGNGLWSNPANWEQELMPPLILRKWDTIFIRTSENDSCLLDVPQTILPGAQIIVQEGSRFIVPADILTDPFPSPIIAHAEVNSPALPGEQLLLTIQVEPGKTPTSSGIQVTADLTSIGGPLVQTLNDAGINGDLVAADLIFNVVYAIPDTVSPGQKVIPYKVWDTQSREDSGLITMTVSQVKGSSLVISQVYYAGGLADATYQNDYVELFNRGNTVVSLDGKSLQYASATGTDLFSTQTPILLTGNLQPGQYYLISLAGGANGQPLPHTADATGSINLAETGGKIALINSVDGLPCNGSSTPCNSEQKSKIIDLAGYGNANYFESRVIPALVLPKASVLLRNWEGAQDTDDNRTDFYPALPTPRSKVSTLNPVNSHVVISQVYTNGGVIYNNDFVELYNAGNQAQSLTGWSLQYADSTSSSWQATPLSGTLLPGQYLLIMQAYTQGSGGHLPQTDLQGNVQMSTTGGKLILLSSNTLLSGSCPTGEFVMDKVGYGQTDCFEGSGPVMTTHSIIRKKSGGLDTDNNQQDFFEGPLYPRNRLFSAYHTVYRFGASIMADTRDGKVYPVKKIGNRVWMLENLNYNATGSRVYNDDPANATIYGRMYKPTINYPNTTSVNGVPSGWRLPSKEDWEALVAMVGTSGDLKDTAFWLAPNTGGTNRSGFGARPGGLFGNNYDETFIYKDIGKTGYFATSTGIRYGGETQFTEIFTLGYQSIYHSYIRMDTYYEGQEFWISVRCIKD